MYVTYVTCIERKRGEPSRIPGKSEIRKEWGDWIQKNGFLLCIIIYWLCIFMHTSAAFGCRRAGYSA